MMALTFRPRYFWAAAALFLIEVAIALWVRDRFVRPYGGDFLVVILIYCTVRAFTMASVEWAAGGVLLFAFAIEICQHFQLGHRLGLDGNPWARVVVGSHFEWLDLLAYTLGIGAVLLVELPGRQRKC